MERKMFKAATNSSVPTDDVLSTWIIVLLKLPSPVKMAIFIGLSKIELAVKTAFRECFFYSIFTYHMALCATKAQSCSHHPAIKMQPNDAKMILSAFNGT